MLSQVNSKIDQISAVELFKNLEDSDKKQKDFYKHFLKNNIIDQVQSKILETYKITEEVFDEDSGEVLSSSNREMTEIEIKDKFLKIASSQTNASKGEVVFIEGIPVLCIAAEEVYNEFQDAGAFVVKDGFKWAGIVLVQETKADLDYDDLQHELIHLATQELGLGKLKIVHPEFDENNPEEYGIAKNEKEVDKYLLAASFIDEALAYGTNAYNKEFLMTPEHIKNYFFYTKSSDVNGYNVDLNSKILANIFNQTIKDRTGKSQFRFNYYLLKHIKDLDDLDFTNIETRNKFERVTGIKLKNEHQTNSINLN